MSYRLSNPWSRSVLFADNNVQAPIIPSVLAAAVDLPLPPSTDESDDKLQLRGGRTLESNSAGSSKLSGRVKPKNPGLNTSEAQKKLGKFFKGLGPSKAPSLPLVPGLIPFCSTRDVGCISAFAYRHSLAIIKHFFAISFCHGVFGNKYKLALILDVHPATWQPFLQGHSFSH